VAKKAQRLGAGLISLVDFSSGFLFFPLALQGEDGGRRDERGKEGTKGAGMKSKSKGLALRLGAGLISLVDFFPAGFIFPFDPL
jgi:hypothetical protein